MAENKPVWCAYRRSQKTPHTRAAASEGSGGSLGDGSAGRGGIRRGDRMHRMRIARFGSCSCTRPSGASRSLYGQHRRRSLCTITTAPEHPQRGSCSGTPNLVCLSCHSSLCTGHRGVSTCLRFEEVERQRGLQADPPRKMRGIKQSQKVHPLRPRMSIRTRAVKKTSWRGTSYRARRDLGLTKEKSCFGSTDSNIYTMTVASANVRTLHLKEERR